MHSNDDIGYQIDCSIFSKMSKVGLYQLKMMLESDIEVDTGGEKQANEDMLSDLNRYLTENKIEV